MRNLTKLAIAMVLAGAGVGMLLPVRSEHREIAVRTNDRTRLRLILQGDGQKDQNLKLLLAWKVFAGSSPQGTGSNSSGTGIRSGSRSSPNS